MNPPLLTIRLNGEPYSLNGASTVATLIEQRNPRPPFAVELNRRLLGRPDYATTELRAGDQVEIVTLVGGG